MFQSEQLAPGSHEAGHTPGGTISAVSGGTDQLTVYLHRDLKEALRAALAGTPSPADDNQSNVCAWAARLRVRLGRPLPPVGEVLAMIQQRDTPG